MDISYIGKLLPYALLSAITWVLISHGELQEQETALQASFYTFIKMCIY